MKKIYIIGDMHTVSAFRLSGVEGFVCTREKAPARLEELITRQDAGIVIVTNEIAYDLHARITEINLDILGPVVVAIPGIDDEQGMIKSEAGTMAQALGIAL